MASTPDNTTVSPFEVASALAETWARALFDMAKEADSLDSVDAEIAELIAIGDTEPKFALFLAHQGIDAGRRAASIKAILEGRVSDLTFRFLMVLNSKGRLGYLPVVHGAFKKLLKDHRNELDVEVYTATELDADQLAGVADKIGKALGRTAIVHPRTDPSLIGGLKIRVGDRLIDASVASHLRRMKTKLSDRWYELSHAAGSGDGPALLEE